MANSCVLQKCVIVNSLNPGKRSGLKKIPFVPLFSPLPVKFTAPPRAPGCHNSNPHLTLPSTTSPIKTTAAVESFCPRGKNNNAAVATSEHHHLWHLPPLPPQPPFIPFPFPDSLPEPKCHTTLHSRCTRGAHTC